MIIIIRRALSWDNYLKKSTINISKAQLSSLRCKRFLKNCENKKLGILITHLKDKTSSRNIL